MAGVVYKANASSLSRKFEYFSQHARGLFKNCPAVGPVFYLEGDDGRGQETEGSKERLEVVAIPLCLCVVLPAYVKGEGLGVYFGMLVDGRCERMTELAFCKLGHDDFRNVNV